MQNNSRTPDNDRVTGKIGRPGRFINFVLDGQQHNITTSHPNFHKIHEMWKNDDWTGIDEAVDIKKSIVNRSMGRLEIRDEEILYDGEPIHNVVVSRIFEFMEQGFPVDPLLKFLEKLMENPSARSVEQLYVFMEKHGLTVTDDGNVLMYKAITNDWKDKHTGKIDNQIGAIVTVPRNKVSDDPRSACSFGLHAGAESYVWSFASYNDRIILVEIDPQDVVSVPYDANDTKIRLCRYKVVKELPNRNEKLTSPLYDEQYNPRKGKPIAHPTSFGCCEGGDEDDDWDEDWDELEEDFFDED